MYPHDLERKDHIRHADLWLPSWYTVRGRRAYRAGGRASILAYPLSAGLGR